MEEIAPNLQMAKVKLENLEKSYEQLQSQASSFLMFSLQWKDLQEHFDSLSKTIDHRFECLNVREKEVESKENQFIVVQKRLNECSQLVREKETFFCALQKSIEECNEEYDSESKKLEETKRLRREAYDDYEAKKKDVASLEALIQEKEKEWKFLVKSVAEFEGKQKELDLVERSLGELTVKVKEKDKKGKLIEKNIEELSKDLEKKKDELSHVQRELNSFSQKFEFKEREFRAIERSVQERNRELHVMEEELKSIQISISDHEKLLQSLQTTEDECRRDIQMIADLANGREQEVKSIQRNIQQCNWDLGQKEEQLHALEEVIKDTGERMRLNDAEYQATTKKYRYDYERMEGELRSIQKKIDRYDDELKGKKEALDSLQKKCSEVAKKLESKGRAYEDLVAKEEELKSFMQKRIDHQIGELEKNKKDCDSIKHKTTEGQVELEMKLKQCEERTKNLESKENQVNEQVKKLELKKEQFEGGVKEFESKQKQFELLRKSFEDEKALIEKRIISLPQVKTEELNFVDTKNVMNSRNLQALFNKLLKVYESACLEVSNALKASVDPAKLVLDSMQGFYPSNSSQEGIEYDANIIRRSCILLLDELKKFSPVISSHVKEESLKLASEWKGNLSVSNKDSLEVLGFLKLVATYDLGSSFDASELQMLLDIISQHCQTSELQQALGNRFNAIVEGRNLQLVVNQENANKLMGSDISVDPQTLDPAKVVLDMIQSYIVPENTKEEMSAKIVGTHIFLLKWLMRISPDIKPQVREEAVKLAYVLKAMIGGSTKNSLEILGFLLLLSIYGLASSFEEDEIFKLFEFVVHHNEAVELLQTLGFANKVSDLIFNLIKKQKPAEAVRFICAYGLADKIPPVDHLREYVQNAKLISKRRSKKSSFETKDKARDEEVACLQTVLKCILDNNLYCQDLVHEIQNRINELIKLKANRVGSTPGPHSKVGVQQPQQKKHTNDVPAKKRQVHPCNNKNNKNKRLRTATRPSVAPKVSNPVYHQPMVWPHHEVVFLPDGTRTLVGPPTNNFGVSTPMGAGPYGNSGRNHFCHP